jgi:hypothetical protein
LIASNSDISDEFVVNSDDQYILKPISEDELIPYLENPSRYHEYKIKCGQNTWFRRVVDSVNWCKAHGYPDYVFQSHVPYVVNKIDYVHCMSQLPWGQGNGFVTHTYLNMAWAGKEPVKEPIGRTVRVKGRGMDMKNAMKNATFLNHNDSGLIPDVKNFLESKFPEPSRWERC